MKKLEVGHLENAEEEEIEMVEFLKKLDLDSISKLYISTQEIEKFDTYFYFKTNRDQEIRFTYRKNRKIRDISIWEEERDYLGMVFPLEEEKEKKQWLNDIWDQFTDYFDLRIRLMFISETTPWKWNTEFTY